jgi:hypothetical protein
MTRNDFINDTTWNRRNTIMTLANLANQAAAYAPSASEVLYRIGLERRRSRASRVASRAGWIGVGMAMGGGLAMWLAPRNGQSVGERFSDTTKRARDYVAPSRDESGDAESRRRSSPTSRAPRQP